MKLAARRPAPTLYLVGTQTPPGAPGLGYIEPLRDAILDLAVRQLAGHEHLVNFTGPDLVSSILLEFLDTGEPAAR